MTTPGERSELHLAIFEHFSAPMMVFDPEGRILRLNPAAEKATGYSLAEIQNRHVWEFFPNAYERARCKELVSEAKSLGLSGAAQLSHGRGHWLATEDPGIWITPEHDSYWLTKSGQKRIFTWFKTAVLNSGGNLEYVVGGGVDVTDRKNAEAQRDLLLESAQRGERRFRFLAEAGSALGSSLDFREILQNLARASVTELADWAYVALVEENFVQATATAHADPWSNDSVRLLDTHLPDLRADEGMAKAIRTCTPVAYHEVEPDRLSSVWPLLDPRGDGHSILQSLGLRSYLAVPILVRGKVLGVIALASTRLPRRFENESEVTMAFDLALRAGLAIENARLYEESQRAVRLREEFLIIASHELKTPLTPLKLQLQLLKRHKDHGRLEKLASEQLEKLISIPLQQANRLERLVEILLDVSRVSSEGLSLVRDDFDLCRLARTVVEDLAAEFKSVGCQVSLDAAGEIIGFWDRMRLEQVLSNLLANAMKYGRGKPIEIRIAPTQNGVSVAVRDHGIGIDKKDQSRIFGRFERAVSMERFSGFGLGLYISEQIIRAHGGTMRVESELGHGATLSFEMPLRT